MRAAVVCPGKSLKWRGREGYDVVIAVNRAALACEPDWVVAYDSSPNPDKPKALQLYGPAACVGLMGHEGHRAHPRPDLTYVAPKEIAPPAVLRDAIAFSACGALVLAAHLGADEVVLHGDDKNGSHYFDGTDCGSGTDARWTREAKHSARIMEHYRDVRFVRA